VSPTFLIQKEGDTVDMFCEATATPAPSLTWRKDGRDLVATDRISVFNNRVQVRRLERQDGGAYSCTFTNVVGQVSHVIKLVVEGEGWISSGNAYIMVPPINTTAEERMRVKLTCQAEGFPNNITYRWYRNGVDVHQTVGLMSRAGIYADGSFVISSTTREDAGWYTCRPTNGLGVAPEATAYLNVTYLPRVVGLTSRVFLARGLTGRLDCPVEANPPATLILWSRNGLMIDDDDDDDGIGGGEGGGGYGDGERRSAGGGASRRMRVGRQGSLFIRSVEDVDEGHYACTPYSPLGKGQTSLPIQVIVRDAPYFNVRPHVFYQRAVGESVTLPCVADGEPMPTVTWKKVDGKFPPSTKTLLEAGNLTIVQLTKDDHGMYECVASNHVASVVTTTLLIVEAVVSHAAYNMTVVTTDTTARVCWMPPYDAGQTLHHVLWYLLVQNSSSQSPDQWQTLQIVPNDTQCVTVYQLQPGTAYQFMVLSRNRYGDAMFSRPIATSTKDDDDGLYAIYVDGHGDNVKEDDKTDIDSDESEYDEDDDYYDPSNNNNHNNDVLSSTIPPTADVFEQYEFGIPNIGPKPLPPSNVTVQQIRTGLIICWQPPPVRASPVPVDHFVIQYRTVGQWVPLTDHVAANATSYTWSTASRGALYQFRVFSVGKKAHSEASQVVSVKTGDPTSTNDAMTSSLIGGAVGILLIVAVSAIIIVVVAKFVIRQRKRAKSIRYGNIKYFGTNQIEGNHNNSVVVDHLVKNDGFASDVMLNATVDMTPTTCHTNHHHHHQHQQQQQQQHQHRVVTPAHVDKQLKETPI
jgi:hypothetical protein